MIYRLWTHSDVDQFSIVGSEFVLATSISNSIQLYNRNQTC